VLIVDPSDESREVLRTVLSQRGLRILEAAAADQGLKLARQHQPDLIVVDVEVDATSPEAVGSEYATASQAQQTPLVLLGSLRRKLPQLPTDRIVRKPFHYGPLIDKIEQLLASQPAQRARAA
jgi:CheY-like chemotaxis protein